MLRTQVLYTCILMFSVRSLFDYTLFLKFGNDPRGSKDPCIDLWLEEEVGADYGSQVLKPVNCVEIIAPDVNIRRGSIALAHNFSLFMTYCETELITCIHEKRSISLWRSSPVCVPSAASSAKMTSLTVICLTLVQALSLVWPS